MSQPAEKPVITVPAELWAALDKTNPGLRVFATFGHGKHGEMVIFIFDRDRSPDQPLYVIDIHESMWQRIELMWGQGALTVPGMTVPDYVIALQTGVVPAGYIVAEPGPVQS